LLGVFFALTADGVVVVKGATSIVQQLFATEMSFWFGLKSPKVRMVEYTQREYENITENLIRVSSTVDKIKLEKELNRSFFMVMEFVPGRRLEELPKEMLDIVMRDREVLQDIGRLILFDLFTNNSDRLPCIWKNEGNLDNVLVAIHFGYSINANLHPIDHGIFCIPRFSQKQNFEQYKRDVREFLQKVYDNVNVPHPSTEKIRNLISIACGVPITQEIITEIQKGIISAMKIASQISKEKLLQTKENFGKLNNTTGRMCGQMA